MKVLVPGRTQRGWAADVVCDGSGFGLGGCLAKLFVEQDDLFTTLGHICYPPLRQATFRCPVCGVLSTVMHKVHSALEGLPDEAALKNLPDYKTWALTHHSKAP